MNKITLDLSAWIGEDLHLTAEIHFSNATVKGYRVASCPNLLVGTVGLDDFICDGGTYRIGALRAYSGVIEMRIDGLPYKGKAYLVPEIGQNVILGGVD